MSTTTSVTSRQTIPEGIVKPPTVIIYGFQPVCDYEDDCFLDLDIFTTQKSLPSADSYSIINNIQKYGKNSHQAKKAEDEYNLARAKNFAANYEK